MNEVQKASVGQAHSPTASYLKASNVSQTAAAEKHGARDTFHGGPAMIELRDNGNVPPDPVLDAGRRQFSSNRVAVTTDEHGTLTCRKEPVHAPGGNSGAPTDLSDNTPSDRSAAQQSIRENQQADRNAASSARRRPAERAPNGSPRHCAK
jgi:hypothetical protein